MLTGTGSGKSSWCLESVSYEVVLGIALVVWLEHSTWRRTLRGLVDFACLCFVFLTSACALTLVWGPLELCGQIAQTRASLLAGQLTLPQALHARASMLC